VGDSSAKTPRRSNDVRADKMIECRVHKSVVDTFETCPAYPENVRSSGQTGSRRGPVKPTRMTHLRHLQFSTPVIFGATAPAHGVGFRLADTANHEVAISARPGGVIRFA
jgi:hypothetical protein